MYKKAAIFYDLDNRGIILDDIPFHKKYAKQAKGDILELACGTGRVTIPLAEGHRIQGLDLSDEMLNELREKVKRLPHEASQNIQVQKGDMSNFNLGKKFSLIIIPFRSFQLLTEPEQISGCLDSVFRHLDDAGTFIMHVFRPYEKLDESWVQPEKLDWERREPRTGHYVKRTHIRRRIDVEKQVIYPEHIYYVKNEEGNEEKIVDHLAMRYFYEDELRGLLILKGFKIKEEMGYFDGRPISEGPELIFVCSKEA